MLNPGRQILAFIAVTATAIAVVDASSRTAIVAAFDYPGGAVLIYGLSMTLVWLTHYVVPFSFSAAYYRLKAFEIDGGIYGRLGIEAFWWLLCKSRIELLNTSVRLSHGRTGLQGLERGMRKAETDHVITLLVMVVVTIYAAMNAWWALVGWLLLVNVVANAYPIMLQRHNRSRVLPVLARLESPKVQPDQATQGAAAR